MRHTNDGVLLSPEKNELPINATAWVNYKLIE